MSNATPKQVSFLSTLAGELGKAVPAVLTSREASALIDQFLAERAKAKAVARATRPELVAEGIYRRSVDGAMFRVQTSEQGNRYAKLLLESGGWGYEKGAIYTLRADERLTLAQLEEWGLSTGVCAICGRLLSTPESVARGIGPICAGRY